MPADKPQNKDATLVKAIQSWHGTILYPKGKAET
jgi:hypothetical protein